MTRQQVAKRLGKSVAMVRRIEGTLLHPTQDVRGTYRFDENEVEDLARGVESGQVTLSHELRRGSAAATTDSTIDFESSDECTSCTELRRQVDALRDELREQRRRHERDLEGQQIQNARFLAERREFETQVAEFMATVNSFG